MQNIATDKFIFGQWKKILNRRRGRKQQMIDFHSHIIPNIDDGSRSIEETFNLLKEAKEAGFEGIVTCII